MNSYSKIFLLLCSIYLVGCEQTGRHDDANACHEVGSDRRCVSSVVITGNRGSTIAFRGVSNRRVVFDGQFRAVEVKEIIVDDQSVRGDAIDIIVEDPEIVAMGTSELPDGGVPIYIFNLMTYSITEDLVLLSSGYSSGGPAIIKYQIPRNFNTMRIKYAIHYPDGSSDQELNQIVYRIGAYKKQERVGEE